MSEDNPNIGDTYRGADGEFVWLDDDRGWVPIMELIEMVQPPARWIMPGTASSSGSNVYIYTYDQPGASGVLKTKLADTAKRNPPPLFGTWLKETKELQESFFLDDRKFSDFTVKDLEQWMMVNSFAAEDEIHEAMAEISWKPWASAEFFNREAFIGEIVDVQHFIANMLVGAGCTDEEFTTAYLEKMERNRKRQTEGYTGTEKCNKCKRAVDDIESHGGYMTQGWVTRILGTTKTRHIQFCNECHPSESAYSPHYACEICEKRPQDLPGYVFQEYTPGPTVHTPGYGCSKCHCDPGDDHK